MISTSYLDRPDDGDDVYVGQCDEDHVLLAGNLIDLATTNSNEGYFYKRYLYKTKVFIDQGNLQAYLLLYDTKLMLIAVRAGQEGRNLVRNHTWSYEQIKRVTVPGDKNRMFLSLDQQEGQEGSTILDISYSSKLVCDSFLFRINILKKIYSDSFDNKENFENSATSHQPNITSQLVTGGRENMTFGKETNPLRDQQATNSNSSPMDDLFSVENLTKLRSAKPVELVVPEVPRVASVAPSTSTNATPNLNINSTSTIVSDTKVKVPIEINAGQPGSYKLEAEAKISFKLNFDLQAILGCRAIQNKEERIKKIRSLINLGDSVCELRIL